MKLLLYCTKTKPFITRGTNGSVYPSCVISDGIQEWHLNGKIVAECEFEVEEIKKVNYNCTLFTNTLDTEKLINKSCVGYFELEKYLKPNWDKEDDLKNLDTVGYAIHIKNLHIFDKPKELSDYYSEYYVNGIGFTEVKLRTAPQNMRYCYNVCNHKYILISIQPQWLCKILNGEKTIEVRKKVLKEMMG